MEIINESLAVKRIEDALHDMDLDQLARLVSSISCDGQVIVVADGEGNVTLQDIVDKDIPCSDVFEDGTLFGFLENNCDIIEIGNRYILGNPCTEQDVGEILTAIHAKAMLPIVDDAQGNTVAWIYANESYIINRLNKE